MSDKACVLLTVIFLFGSFHALAQQPLSSRNLAYAWMDDLNRHDTIALAALYADTAQILSPNRQGGGKTGPAGIREFYNRYFTGTPDLQHQLTHLIATDSFLVIEYISHGIFSHPEGGTPAYMKDKAYSLQNSTRLDIHDGKILRQVNYFDQVAFLRQVGFFDQK
jgi:steroid delta-isomerase-like uncharacterized protein